MLEVAVFNKFYMLVVIHSGMCFFYYILDDVFLIPFGDAWNRLNVSKTGTESSRYFFNVKEKENEINVSFVVFWSQEILLLACAV